MLRFTIPSGTGSLVLHDGVLRLFDRFRQRRRWQREVGGQLFARFEGPATVIIEATAPSRFDLRLRTSFQPQRAAQQREIDNRFRRGLHFVGDWHSHPELVPTPSSLDVASMKECLHRSRHELKALVLIIVGTQLSVESLWVGIVTRHAVQRLDGESSFGADRRCAGADWQQGME